MFQVQEANASDRVVCRRRLSQAKVLAILVASYRALDAQVGNWMLRLARRAKINPVARRLMTEPGVAMAFMALVAAPENFQVGRDFAAQLGLVPVQPIERRQGKAQRGRRTIRRLLMLGGSRVLT